MRNVAAVVTLTRGQLKPVISLASSPPGIVVERDDLLTGVHRSGRFAVPRVDRDSLLFHG
jgi:hypothetical protein